MKARVKRFVPGADEVWRLQHGKGADCDLFREVAEQGHYGGRTQPSDTRQGTYAFAPSGAFLASINTNDPAAMARMLEQALVAWKKLGRDERRLPADRRAARADAERLERLYPTDGLVLVVVTRDVGRSEKEKAADRGRPADWRAAAFNRDFAWFRRDEALAFVPDEGRAGAERDVPRPLVERLARFSLVDNVRGQTPAYRPEHVEVAELRSRVVKADGARLTLRLEGRTRTRETGRWPVRGFEDAGRPTEQERGYEAKLLGRATLDRGTGRFVAFELVALGERRGGTQYNFRGDDLDPAPLGVALTLAGDDPEDRVAPAHVWAYGWK